MRVIFVLHKLQLNYNATLSRSFEHRIFDHYRSS